MKINKSFMIVPFIFVLVFYLTACDSPQEKAQEYYDSGMNYFENKSFDKAKIEFKNALQIDQGMVKAMWGIVQVAEKQNEKSEVYRYLKQIVAHNPNHIKALVKLGRIMLMAGKIPESLELSDKSMAIDSNNKDVLALRSAIFLKTGDYLTSKKLANQALKIDPHFIEALVILTANNIIEKRYKNAEAIAERGLKVEPGNVTLNLLKIQSYKLMSDNKNVEKTYKYLISEYPGAKTFVSDLVSFYVLNHEQKKAEELFLSRIKEKPDDSETILEYINYLIRYKNIEFAQNKLESYIKSNPDNDELKLNLVKFYLKKNSQDMALGVLDSLISDSEDRKTVFSAKIIKAGIFIDNNDIAKAGIIIDSILKSDSRNEDASILKANVSILEREYDNAISTLRPIIEDNPKSSQARFYLAKAYQLSGSVELADKEYFEAFKYSDYDSGYGLKYTSFLIKRNQFDKAEKILNIILRVSPANVEAKKILAQLLIKRGDFLSAENIASELRELDKSVSNEIKTSILVKKDQYSEAISQLEQMTSSAPDNISIISNLVRVYVVAGKKLEAISFLEALLKENSGNNDLKLLLAKVYFLVGNFDKSKTILDEIIYSDKRFDKAYYEYAKIYLSKSQYKKAEMIVDKGLSDIPESFVLNMMKASLLEERGDIEGALLHYKNAIRINPDSEIALNNTASLLTEIDDKSAKEAYKLSLRFKDSGIPYFLDTYGWASYKTGRYNEARKSIEKAIKLDSSVTDFYYHLGMICYSLKDSLCAKNNLNKVLKASNGKYDKNTNQIKSIIEKLN